MSIFEVISNILIAARDLITNLIILFGYTIFYSILAIFIYLLIIRPIWGSLFKKGERLYWLSVLLTLIYAFLVGPIIFMKIVTRYEDYGIIIGLIVYLSGVYIIGYHGMKQETQKLNSK